MDVITSLSHELAASKQQIILLQQEKKAIDEVKQVESDSVDGLKADLESATTNYEAALEAANSELEQASTQAELAQETLQSELRNEQEKREKLLDDLESETWQRTLMESKIELLTQHNRDLEHQTTDLQAALNHLQDVYDASLDVFERSETELETQQHVVKALQSRLQELGDDPHVISRLSESAPLSSPLQRKRDEAVSNFHVFSLCPTI